ncbi:MAG: hypothetical protein RBR63_01800 [Methanosarcina vacuolata]|nr:hypothetical protein [Methanosarcina vacuolata]
MENVLCMVEVLQGRSAFEFPVTGEFPAVFVRKKYFRIGSSE